MKEDSFAKYSAASKARWAKRSPEERSAKMRAIALLKWSKMNPEDRRAHSLLMIKAKQDVKNQKGS